MIIKTLGLVDYQQSWQAMQDFTESRTATTPDEIWILQHNPVYTLGQAGDPSHLVKKSDIPVIKIDRGGQITYHGPGQIVAYVLIDIKRLSIGIRQLVNILEQSIIILLADLKICGHTRHKAPGVYVDNKKIAALGLRIKKGCSYHGLSLNVNMNLDPFLNINPCGLEGLEVTQLADLGISQHLQDVGTQLSEILTKQFQQCGNRA